MFTKILVEGFKCFKDRTEAELRPLTILAGANSSGKSSLVQPLLLLKQTLLSEADPGPLRLDGPNVVFTTAKQLFWNRPRESRQVLRLGFWIDASRKGYVKRSVGVETELTAGEEGLEVSGTVWYDGATRVPLRPDMSFEKINDVLPGNTVKMVQESFGVSRGMAQVERLHTFLRVVFGLPDNEKGTPIYFFSYALPEVPNAIRRTIHVPGLRGNPQRSYPVRAPSPTFAGLFNEYVATIIENWEKQRANGNGKTDSEDKIHLLQNWLRTLELTRKVGTKRRSEIEIEIRVARTVRGKRGWGKDLISIADAGFGLSQSLPVVVALLAAEKEQTVYIEQPEIHLHPDAQVGMAQVFSRALRRGIQIIAETHSPLFLLGIQKEIAEGNLKPEDVVLHWFSRDPEGASRIFSTGFNRDGSYENPKVPVDFADISMRLMRDFLTAAANV